MDRESVSALRAALADRRDVRLALLFGSQARGVARADSDFDVAVDAPGTDLLALRADLSLRFGHEVDVVDLREAGVPLLQAILRDGILLRAGAPHALARFYSAAIATLETDLPGFVRMRDAYLRRLAGAT